MVTAKRWRTLVRHRHRQNRRLLWFRKTMVARI